MPFYYDGKCADHLHSLGFENVVHQQVCHSHLGPVATWPAAALRPDQARPAAALSHKPQRRLPRATAQEDFLTLTNPSPNPNQEDFFERVLDKKFLKTIDLIWDNPPVRPAPHQPRASPAPAPHQPRACSRPSEQHSTPPLSSTAPV